MQKFPGYSFLIDFFPTFETARSSRTLRKALAKPREAPAHRGRLSQYGGKVPHTAEGSRKTAGRFRTPRKALAKRRESSAHRGRLSQNRSIEENSYSLLNIFELWQLKSRVQAQT